VPAGTLQARVTEPRFRNTVALVVGAFRAEMTALLDKKHADLLAPVKITPAYRSEYEKLTALRNEVEEYNAAVEEANKQIEAFKAVGNA
jgi:hypothetical protein